MDLVVHDISLLLTMADAGLGPLSNAAVGFEAGKIAWVGPTGQAPKAARHIDAGGAVGVPGLVDCHTHAVWAGSRADEFRRRLAGASYTEILEAGGGILSTVRATRECPDLAGLCAARLRRLRSRGVTTVEVKSGYGLEVEAEKRCLRAARAAGTQADVRVLTTFLGAHAVPAEWRPDRAGYVRNVIEEQLPAVVELADFIDVYVDRGAFTVEEGRDILIAGRAAGLGLRVHAEQVAFTGAARMAAELGALSADHLERIDSEGIASMAEHGTIAVLLPGAMLYLNDPPPPVAQLRDAGVPLAVASDLNPGSSPVWDLWLCATLATLTLGLTVEEALLGVTRVAADALGRPDLGRVELGATGDLVLVSPPPGEPATTGGLVQHLGGVEVRRVIKDGKASP